METFFTDESSLRYWLCNASVSHITCSVSWPPVIAAVGYAPCVRAWAPTSRDDTEIRPVQQLLEVDGERFVAVTVKGDLLIAADASISGRISIWDTRSWIRHQTLTAGAPVTCLDASRTFIAAGTSQGYVRVWRRQSPSDPTFAQLFTPDLKLDTLPVYCVKLGPMRGPQGSTSSSTAGLVGGGDGGSGDAVMVVHTKGNGRVSAWRLSDAKILGTLGRSGPADSPEALLSSNVVHACLAKDVLLTCSWLPGKDPLLQWIHPIQRAGGEVPGVSQHLAGVARPLCCDYDGSIIVLGCEDGVVWVWGLIPQQKPHLDGQLQTPQQQLSQPDVSHWRGYHRGQVGAVACLPHRNQIASAGADAYVKLWSTSGNLLAVVGLSWQPCALAVNEVALIVGGAAGHIQILVLLTDEQTASAASRPTEVEREASVTPFQGSSEVASAAASYAHWFDARSPKAIASGGCNGAGRAGAGMLGLASEHPDAFAAFVPPLRQVTLADLQHQQQPSLHEEQLESWGAASVSGGILGGEGADESSPAGEATAAGSGRASSFNMQAAVKGAQRNAAAEQVASAAAEEAAKKAQLRAMGEGLGVARTRTPVQLDSATAVTMGRKCANPSCMQREGLLELKQQHLSSNGGAGFKRCGACRSTFYCSAHCQSTHWRDGHKKECPKLVEASRLKQLQLKQEQDELQNLQQQQQQQTKGTTAGGGLVSSTCGSECIEEGGGEGGSEASVQAPTPRGTPAPGVDGYNLTARCDAAAGHGGGDVCQSVAAAVAVEAVAAATSPLNIVNVSNAVNGFRTGGPGWVSDALNELD